MDGNSFYGQQSDYLADIADSVRRIATYAVGIDVIHERLRDLSQSIYPPLTDIDVQLTRWFPAVSQYVGTLAQEIYEAYHHLVEWPEKHMNVWTPAALRVTLSRGADGTKDVWSDLWTAFVETILKPSHSPPEALRLFWESAVFAGKEVLGEIAASPQAFLDFLKWLFAAAWEALKWLARTDTEFYARALGVPFDPSEPLWETWLKILDVLFSQIGKGAVSGAKALTKTLSDVVTKLIRNFTEYFPFLHIDSVESAFKFIIDLLAGKVVITPEVAPTAAASAVIMSWLAGTAAHIWATICEIFQPLKQLGLHQFAAFLAELGGFKVIVAATLGVLFQSALHEPFASWIQYRTRPNIPEEKHIEEWFPSDMITVDQAWTYYAYEGYKDQWIPHLLIRAYHWPFFEEQGAIAGVPEISMKDMIFIQKMAGIHPAWRPIIARGLMLRQFMNNQWMSQSDISQMLRWGTHTVDFTRSYLRLTELRPEVVELTLQQGLARQDFYQKLAMLQKTETAYAQGLVSDEELERDARDIGLPPQGIEMLKARAFWARKYAARKNRGTVHDSVVKTHLTRMRGILEDAFRQGIISDNDYLAALEALGYDAGDAELFLIEAQWKVRVQVAKIEHKAIEREVRELQREYARAYRYAVRNGWIDLDTYQTYLEKIGYTPQMARAAALIEKYRRKPTAADLIEEMQTESMS